MHSAILYRRKLLFQVGVQKMGSFWPLELVVCLNLHIKCILPEVIEVVRRIRLIIDKPKKILNTQS